MASIHCRDREALLSIDKWRLRSRRHELAMSRARYLRAALLGGKHDEMGMRRQLALSENLGAINSWY